MMKKGMAMRGGDAVRVVDANEAERPAKYGNVKHSEFVEKIENLEKVVPRKFTVKEELFNTWAKSSAG